MPDPDQKHVHREHESVSDGEAEKAAGKRKRAPGGGRKPKQKDALYIPISMRLHPKVFEWAKAEAEKRGIGYQSLINEILLDQMS
jgi:uncharacterized protein (DUF4415 family)